MYSREVISLFPSLFETIVLPLKANDVEERIESGIQRQVFYGRLDGSRFQLTAKVVRPTVFQPVLCGTIESTSRGSIIWLHYRLLRSTRLYLSFCSALLLPAVGVIAWNKQHPWYAATGLAVVLMVWWIAKTNLKLQSALARQVLLDQLT